jgi:hypothetical protein
MGLVYGIIFIFIGASIIAVLGMSKKSKKSKTQLRFDKILNDITPERRAELDAQMEAHLKWMDEHPDYNERYGTDKSYWLQQIKDEGFNPVGITVMTCEETIIMKTQEEIDAAWKIFKPEGWWYTVDQWEATREEYVRDCYDGVEADAPRVYCLDDNYKHLIK